MKEQKAAADCHPFETIKTTFVYDEDFTRLPTGQIQDRAQVFEMEILPPHN